MKHVARRLLPLTVLVAAFVVISGLVVGFNARGTSAQEGEAAYPAHIHDGSCAELGNVKYPLNSVSEELLDDAGTPVAGTQAGFADAAAVDVSVTIVQADLSALTGEPYAINIHESTENIRNYIACGDIGGMVFGSDLAIGLNELNDSGYSGIATLHDNGDGTTTVSVYLTEEYGGDDEEEATPAASGNAAPAAGEAAVSIANFAFEPATLEIAVGTTVTWTNSDSAKHTATQDGGGFQSNGLNTGETYSETFDTPGTYEYYCEFHANMRGTIIVK